MTEEAQVAPEEVAAPETVTPEADQASEATENTQGQIDDQPAEDEGQPEAEDKASASKARRERRKAEVARVKQEAKEAQDRADAAERELARLKGVESKPPKLEDFDNHDEYLAELSAYKAEQRLTGRQVQEAERAAEESKKQAQALHQRRMEEAAQNWAAQTDDARTRYADFDAVVSAPDVPISPDMAQLIKLSDNGADVAYHLGMNKELARELAQMPAPELVGAMRMLERTVTAQTPKPRTTTNAPDPVKPLKGGAAAVKDPSKMSPAEYRAWRESGGTF